MSNSVDNRIVQMKFDNAHFEKGVQTSLKSLDTLNKSLTLTESTRGLESIGQAANKIDLSGLTNGIETIGLKFSALQVMAVTALSNITNTALNAGKKIISALTIDPIKTGLSEYETKINAIQVIKANTQGVNTMDEITAALDELNTYADQTIYNFAQMTSNVGKFVAQGLDVNAATQAIKGLANLAAASGANAEDMSRATYQMSQALGGTIRAIDWNSLRSANMATTTLKDTLVDIAKVNGLDVDAMIKDKGTFEQSLELGWLSGDMFSEAMNIYSDTYSEAELIAKGYNDEQVKRFKEIAKTAQEAATEVKTITQLWGVLQETAQSGWTQSWEYIFGDFEQAKESFTQAQVYLSGIINASADARNAMLKAWSSAGGRTMAIDALKNTFNGLLSVITPIKEAFQEIFPPLTATNLLNMTKAIKDFTGGLILSEETSKNLKSTFKGLFAALDIVGQAFGAIFEVVVPLFGSVKDASGGVLALTGSFGEFLVRLDETIRKTDFFRNIMQKTISAVQTGFNKVKSVISVVMEKLSEFGKWAQEKFGFPGIEAFHMLLERVHDRMTNIMHSADTLRDALNDAFQSLASSKAFTSFSDSIEKVSGFFTTLWNIIKKVGKGISSAMGDAMSSVSGAIGEADFDTIFDIINGGLVAGLLVGLNKFISGFGNALDSVGDMVGTFSEIKVAVLDTFGAFQEQLKAGTLLKIAGAIALLTASLVVLSLIDSERLSTALVAISTLFVELMVAMEVFSKITGGSFKTMTTMTASMIGISVAVLILAGAMKILSTLDWDGVAKGLISIAALTTMLLVTAKVLSKSSGKMMGGMTGLLLFTFAVRNLTDVVVELGSLNPDTLTKGLVGVGVLIGELAGFMVAAKFGKMGISTGLGLMALATAINILASSVQTFGAMDITALIQGLGAIGIVLLELAIFTQLNKGSVGMIATATGMVILGAALKIFASAIADLGSIPIENLIKGLSAMAIALGVVALTMNAMPKNMIIIGVGLIAVGAALLIISNALTTMGGMTWEEIAKGLLTLAIGLGVITIALYAMPKNMIIIGVGLIAVGAALLIISNALTTMGGMTWEEIAKGLLTLAIGLGVITIALYAMTGTLAGSAALLVAAGALAVLTPVLAILGAMSWESIAKGLVALAGTFIVLGVAGLVLAPLIPVILGLGAAVALIGVGIATAGVGLMLIGLGLAAVAAGFTALAAIGATGAVAVVAALTIIIEGIASLIPFVLEKIGEGLITLAEIIIKATPILVEAVVVVVTELVKGLIALIPLLVDGVFVLLDALLKTVVEFTPSIVSSVLTILVQILEGIALALPSIIQAGVDIIVAFIQGVASASVQLVDAAFQAMITFINGLAESIRTNSPILIEAINNLMTAVIEAAILVITNSIENFKKIGSKIMNSGFIQGIKDKFEDAKTAIKDMVVGMVDAIKNKTSDFKDAAGEVVNGFVQGIKDKFSDAVQVASDLGSVILNSAKKALGIESPSKEFAELGRWSDLGLVQGLKKYSYLVYGAATDVADGTVSAMRSSFNGISSVIDDSMDLNPVITPILDLTNVTNGAKEISSMFANRQLAVSGDVGQNGGDGKTGANYQFVQNNYSPKALSRAEIYRNTRNQFAKLKEGLV